ncbi:unnamed protein product [Owenia fusiformis]|uniref:Uncharacterized protein n=1 Tax=Owenia fusiformis TaxID=6347 RepID=A0A8J1UFA9_OWEFU|nr:unnamed protein product [Owenia fusiformis]
MWIIVFSFGLLESGVFGLTCKNVGCGGMRTDAQCLPSATVETCADPNDLCFTRLDWNGNTLNVNKKCGTQSECNFSPAHGCNNENLNFGLKSCIYCCPTDECNADPESGRTCRANEDLVNGNCIQYISTSSTFAEAETYCNSIRSSLGLPSSDADVAIYLDILAARGAARAWVGLKYYGSTINDIHGEPTLLSLWGLGRPRSPAVGECLEVHAGSVTGFSEESCGMMNPFFCSRKPGTYWHKATQMFYQRLHVDTSFTSATSTYTVPVNSRIQCGLLCLTETLCTVWAYNKATNQCRVTNSYTDPDYEAAVGWNVYGDS